jgi:folate-binding protein YgfZ
MQAFDPRLPILGKRIWKLTRPGTGVRTAVEQSSRSARCYHSFWLAELHRVLHAVPQGTRDVVPGQALPLECNFEQLGAIAFDKGCYLGQELTARTHYTGVVRKRTVAGVLSPDHEDALARAQQAAAFVQTVHRGGKDQVATLFPAQTLHWPVPEALQQQLIHDSQKRIELELVQGASPAGTRTRATLGTVVANLATALVSLADTDLDTSSTTMSHLFQIPEQVSSPIAKWFFAWWVPPYLQNAGSVSSASPVSRPSLS